MRSSAAKVFILACAGLLAACNSGVSFTGEDVSTTPPPPAGSPTSITLLVSSVTINSGATAAGSGVTLLATVRDASQNIVPGVQVRFSTPDAGMNITVTTPVTDANGRAEGELTVFSDRSDRDVTVVATIFGTTISSSLVVRVDGTTLALSGPTSGQFQTAANYVATLRDSAQVPISGVSVTFSGGGTFSPAATVTTNGAGQATVAFTPTTSANSTTLVATAIGETASQLVTLSQDSFAINAPTLNQEIPLGTSAAVSATWTRSGSPVVGKPVTFSATRGTLSASTVNTDATGVASVTISSTQAGPVTLVASGVDTVPNPDSTPTTSSTAEFVATTPTQISVQASETVIGTNQQSSISATVRDAANNLVKNATVQFSLQDTTGGTISAPSAITNSQGVASVVYASSSTTSADKGVKVTGTVQGTAVTGFVELTVGSLAARITLGTGNQLFENDPTTYRLPYTAIVTDNAGNAVPEADLRLRIVPTEFSKGYYISGDPPVQVITATCLNEDVNLDGILQLGEDTDGDGRLDPGNVASVPSGSLPLDANGRADFNILYPQDRGNWVRVRLSATANVTGTEATETANFDLVITEPDSQNPPGNPSPYGVISRCDLDDENVPLVQFQTVAQNAVEGNAGTSSITVNVTRSKAFTEDIIVPLFYGGSATNGTDYSGPTSVTILAADADNAQSFTVDINGDVALEPTETIQIFVGQPSNARVGTNDVHTVTIPNDD